MKKLLLLTTLIFPCAALTANADVVASGALSGESSSVALNGAGSDAYKSNHSDKEFLQVQVFSPNKYDASESPSINDSIFLDKDNEFMWKLDCLSSVHPMASCKVAAGMTDVKRYLDDKRAGKGPFGLPKVDKRAIHPYVADNEDAKDPYGFGNRVVDPNDRRAVQELTLTTLTRTVKVRATGDRAIDAESILNKGEQIASTGDVNKAETSKGDKNSGVGAAQGDNIPQSKGKGILIKNPKRYDSNVPTAYKEPQPVPAGVQTVTTVVAVVVDDDKEETGKDIPMIETPVSATEIVETDEAVLLVPSAASAKSVPSDTKAKEAPAKKQAVSAKPASAKSTASRKTVSGTSSNQKTEAADTDKVKPAKSTSDKSKSDKKASKAKSVKQDKGKVSLKQKFAKVKRPEIGPSISAKPDMTKKSVAEPVVTVSEKTDTASEVKKVQTVEKKPVLIKTTDKPAVVLLHKKVEKPVAQVKKDDVKRPTLSIKERLYIALAKVLGGQEIEERLEGLEELGFIAKEDTQVHDKIARSLLAFLSERASFKRSAELASVPKTDIEQALIVLSRLELGQEGLSFKNLDFSGIQLAKVAFKNADFSDVGFVGAKISDVDFSGSKFVGADFSKATLADVKFVGSNLETSYFADAFLKNVNFKNANLSCAVFKSAKIISCNFSGAKMTSVWLAEAKVLNSSFLKTDLTRSDFGNAAVYGNTFTASIMDNVNFIGSSHRGNNFTYANFNEVFVKSVDLSSDVGITLAMMLSSVFDKDTKVPTSISKAFAAVLPQEQEQCKYDAEVCKAKLAPFSGNYTELTDVSVKVLTSSKANMWQRNWAACNVACIMNEDKELGAKGIAALASMVQRERPWPPKSNRQSESASVPPDVASALYVIGHRPETLKGMSVDLTKTDLHKVDFYGYDMTGVNFAGSNLKGASTTKSIGLPDNLSSTIAPLE